MTADVRERLRLWLLSGERPQPAGAADAALLVEAAQAQGLAGRLDAAVAAAHDDQAWPPAARAALRDAHRAALLHGTRLLSLATRVQGLLERQGLRALPLKGVAQAAAGLVPVADRPMRDVDVLLLDDWDPALSTLTSAGFQRGEAADHALCLHDPETREVMELHHSLTSCPGLYPVDREGLWRRSRLASEGLRVPATEDLLVLSGLHAAFQHGLVLPLGHYLDFPVLLSQASFDVSLAAEIAARARAGLTLRVALEAAEAVVGARVPEALRRQLPTPHRALARWLAAHLGCPLSLLSPSRPPLARLRWELARGHRPELIHATLAPARPFGSAASLRPGEGTALARAFGLARRWGLGWLRPRGSSPGALV